MLPSATLRRQIALITGGALLVVLAILVAFFELRMGMQLERMAVERSRSATELLTAVRRQDTVFLKRLTTDLTTAPALGAVLQGGPAERLAEEFEAIASALEFETGLIAYESTGTLIASHGVAEPETFASTLLPTLSEDGRIADLVLPETGDKIWITVSSEVLSGDDVVGHVVGRVDLVARVKEFFGAADSLAFVFPIGDVIVMRGEHEGLPDTLRDCCMGTTPNDVVSIGSNRYTASVVPVFQADGALLGHFVDLRDVTAEMARLRPFRILSIAAVIVVVLLSTGILMRSLRHALRPLGAVVRLIERLSAGQTEARLKPVAAAREIESLIRSVETFRAGIAARDRLLVLGEQLAAARRIQQSLLPSEFDLADGIELFGAMEPAEEVAGDFFDCFPLPDGRIAAVIADVAGKGIGAALFAARASAMIRANATVLSDPAEIMMASNDELCDRNPEHLFISVLLAIIDAGSGKITFSNAGHCPPILVDADGDCRMLKTDADLVLGAVPDMTYTGHRYRLAVGETMLLFSDGFDEARDPSDRLLGTRRALDIAAEAVPFGAERGVGRIFQKLRDFAGGRPQSDDITLLALRRTATS